MKSKRRDPGENICDGILFFLQSVHTHTHNYGNKNTMSSRGTTIILFCFSDALKISPTTTPVQYYIINYNHCRGRSAPSRMSFFVRTTEFKASANPRAYRTPDCSVKVLTPNRPLTRRVGVRSRQ